MVSTCFGILGRMLRFGVYSIPLSNEAGSSVLAGSELGLGLLSFAASEQLANNKINNASPAADDSST